MCLCLLHILLYSMPAIRVRVRVRVRVRFRVSSTIFSIPCLQAASLAPFLTFDHSAAPVTVKVKVRVRDNAFKPAILSIIRVRDRVFDRVFDRVRDRVTDRVTDRVRDRVRAMLDDYWPRACSLRIRVASITRLPRPLHAC